MPSLLFRGTSLTKGLAPDVGPTASARGARKAAGSREPERVEPSDPAGLRRVGKRGWHPAGVLSGLPHGPIDSAVVPGREFVVGVSGASGASLPRRFVELVSRSRAVSRLHLVISASSLAVARTEIDPAIATATDWVSRLNLPRDAARLIALHSNDDVGATIASGSYPVAGMAVIPCSAGTLGAIANGVSRDLLQRAADVCLKERRPLVLAFRESPYSLVHVENMRRATLAGAIVAPPSPAFYVRDPSMDRFLDAWCVRAARLLGIELPDETFRWAGTEKEGPRTRRRS